MADADPLVRMRCADAVEKITLRRPAFLASHKQQLIRLAQTATQPEVRWHIAQLVSRLEWNGRERRRVAGILFSYLEDESRIVKTFSMQALADIAGADAQLRGPVLRRLQQLTRTGSPAMRSRGRKLLARLRK
jgi:hypothetical protein